jgi:hypothetical protein
MGKIASSTTKLETEICSRCLGTGSYSWCPQYGSKCFRCAGRKRTLTDRGEAALNWMRAFNIVPATLLAPGMILLADLCSHNGPYSQYIIIGEIALDSATGIYTVSQQNGEIKVRYNVTGTATIKHSPEYSQYIIGLAVKYQETLTKKGKVRKRAHAK